MIFAGVGMCQLVRVWWLCVLCLCVSVYWYLCWYVSLGVCVICVGVCFYVFVCIAVRVWCFCVCLYVFLCIDVCVGVGG